MNKKHKVIIARAALEFQQELNKFAATDVKICATQTHFIPRDPEDRECIQYMAVVYYDEIIPPQSKVLHTIQSEESKAKEVNQ